MSCAPGCQISSGPVSVRTVGAFHARKYFTGFPGGPSDDSIRLSGVFVDTWKPPSVRRVRDAYFGGRCFYDMQLSLLTGWPVHLSTDDAALTRSASKSAQVGGPGPHNSVGELVVQSSHHEDFEEFCS